MKTINPTEWDRKDPYDLFPGIREYDHRMRKKYKAIVRGRKRKAMRGKCVSKNEC